MTDRVWFRVLLLGVFPFAVGYLTGSLALSCVAVAAIYLGLKLFVAQVLKGDDG
ncbi:hypothetical protein [Candidatus Poriferisodalis sp.]|uniref:hypothetical protein n=1 Tax=Candidatus Poriferisodalis sp. TaxID=3101277 RepID=UPI003D0BC664